MQSSPNFRARLGMIETRFALPQRSPKPFIVPCTWPTPSVTAASEFATAHSASLWTWMPSGVRTTFLTSRRISTSCAGSVPPFVSHSTSQWAPARSAARTACHAEGGQLGVLECDVLHAPEEAEVLGVRARPAPLYIMDAESVQPRGQTDLVFHRKGDAFTLRPIAKCRVVNLDQTA